MFFNSNSVKSYALPNDNDYDKQCRRASQISEGMNQEELVNPDGNSYLASKHKDSDTVEHHIKCANDTSGYDITGSGDDAKFFAHRQCDSIGGPIGHLPLERPVVYIFSSDVERSARRAISPMSAERVLASRSVIVHIPHGESADVAPKKLPKGLAAASKAIDITSAILGALASMTVSVLSAIWKENREKMFVISMCSAAINFLLAIGPLKSRIIDIWKGKH
jgi:hypothetical protein